MKKNGFSLAETLIVIAMIGVLTGFALQTLQTFDKDLQYTYSNVYYNLDRAWHNARLDYIQQNPAARDPFLKNAAGNQFAVTNAQGTQRLCQALIQYINPTNNAGSCAANRNITAMGAANELDDRHLQFTATNGVRFWISNRYPNDTSRQNFYVIFADLNGNRLPNSMRYVPGTGRNRTKTVDPDIFALAVLEEGRVCPIGLPEVNTRYMSTRVMFTQENGDSALSGESTAYVVSKAQAWGYYVPRDNQSPQQVQAENLQIIESPLSYNDYIRDVLSNPQTGVPGNNIYSFLGGADIMTYFRANFPHPAIGINDANPPQGWGCARKSMNCEVVVDKYVY